MVRSLLCTKRNFRNVRNFGFNGKHPMSPLLTNLRPQEHISRQPRSQGSPTWNQLGRPAVVGLTVLEYATDL